MLHTTHGSATSRKLLPLAFAAGSLRFSVVSPLEVPSTSDATPARGSELIKMTEQTAGRSSGATLALMLLLAHAALRILEQTVIRTGMSIDGLAELPLVDSWQWGYHLTQPPLYTWIFKLVLLIVPDFRVADVILRQILVSAVVWLCFSSLRRMGLSPRDAAFSAAGMFLISDFAWDVQATFTHSVLALVTLNWFVLQFLILRDRKTLAGYVLLGVAIGCVTLSKYNALLPVVGLLLAALTLPRWRKVVFCKAFLLAPLGALLVSGPHLIWRQTMSEPFLAPERIWNEGALDGPPAFLVGTAGVALVVLAQTLPLIIVLAITFRGRLGWLRTPRATEPDCHAALFWRAFLISLSIFLAVVITWSATNIVMRWILPTASLLVLALPSMARAAGRLSAYARGIFTGAIVVTSLAFVGMTVRDALVEPFFAMDYRAFTSELGRSVAPFDAYTSFREPKLNSVALYRNVELLTPGSPPRPDQTIALAWPEASDPDISSMPWLPADTELSCDVSIALQHRFREILSQRICVQQIQ